MIPAPVIRCLINDFEKIVGHLTLSHKGTLPHHKPTHVDFTLSAFNDKRHSASCQSKFVKKTTVYYSLPLELKKSGLET